MRGACGMDVPAQAAANSRSECAARPGTEGPALGADCVEGPEAHGIAVAHSAGGQWGHWCPDGASTDSLADRPASKWCAVRAVVAAPGTVGRSAAIAIPESSAVPPCPATPPMVSTTISTRTRSRRCGIERRSNHSAMRAR